MAVPIFSPVIGPSTSSTSVATDARVLTAGFGDGYQQVTADGINTYRDTWTLQWDGISNAEMQSLLAFMQAQAGYIVFQWTAPGETVPKLWRCGKWGRNPTGPASWTFTATFVQSFDQTTTS